MQGMYIPLSFQVNWVMAEMYTGTSVTFVLVKWSPSRKSTHSWSSELSSTSTFHSNQSFFIINCYIYNIIPWWNVSVLDFIISNNYRFSIVTLCDVMGINVCKKKNMLDASVEMCYNAPWKE